MRKKILLGVLCASIIIQCMSMLTVSAQKIGEFENGGFENGTSGWFAAGNGYNVATADKRSGEKSLSFKFNQLQYARFMQPILVKKNTLYTLSFYMVNTAGDFECAVTHDGTNLHTAADGSGTASLQTGTNNSWSNKSISFYTGDNEEILFTIKNITLTGTATAYFDDFGLAPVTRATDTLVNGGFEESGPSLEPASQYKYGWDSIQFNVQNSVVHSGSYAGLFWGAWCEAFQQTIPVRKNTDYTFSFWYKTAGTDLAANDRARMRIYNENGKADANVLIPSGGDWTYFPLSAEWKKATASFNSGNNGKITILVGRGGSFNTGLYADDFMLTPALNTVENGNFEIAASTLDGWEAVNAAAVADSARGGNVVKLSPNGGTIPSIKQTIPVEQNKNYTISYYYKNEAGGNSFSIYDQSQTTDLAEKTVKTDITSTYQQVTKTFNSGSNSTITIEAANSDAATAISYFDDIVLSRPQPSVLVSRVWGYVADGNTLYAQADGTDLNGDTLSSYAYQWQSSADGSTWTDIEGAVNDTYTITDSTKSYRVGITAVGAANTGSAVYSEAAFTDKATFSTAINNRINEKMSYLPGWYSNDATSMGFREFLLKIARAAKAYDVVSKDTVTSWDDYINYASLLSWVDTSKVTCSDNVTIDVDFIAPVETARLVNAQFKLYNAADTSTVLTNYTITPKGSFNYIKKDGTTEVSYSTGMTITLNSGYEANAYVLKRATFSLNLTENFAVPATVLVKDVSAVKTGNSISVTANIKNANITDTIDSFIVTAAYDAAGKLISADVKTPQLVKGADATSLSATLDAANASKVSLFVWKNELVPLTEKIPVTVN